MAEAELTTVARPYARAAFSFAVSQDLEGWSRMLALLAEAVNQDVVSAKLDDPKLTTEAGAAVLISLLGSDLNENGRNFVNVLAQYGRIELLPNIAKQFELLKAEHEKTVNVDVISAYEITGDEAEKLSQTLHTWLQRDVNLTTEVDASLLGGVVVKAEDTVIDNSIRGKLRKLSQALQ